LSENRFCYYNFHVNDAALTNLKHAKHIYNDNMFFIKEATTFTPIVFSKF